MKPRERVLCALAGDRPDRVPFCEGSVAANVARALARSDQDLSEREISDLLGRDVVVTILFPPYFADQKVGSDGQAYMTTAGSRSGPTDGFRLDLDGWLEDRALYYAMMGWDEKGVPTAAKLHELELRWVVEQLAEGASVR
jgi:hypothetical protein